MKAQCHGICGSHPGSSCSSRCIPTWVWSQVRTDNLAQDRLRERAINGHTRNSAQERLREHAIKSLVGALNGVRPFLARFCKEKADTEDTIVQGLNELLEQVTATVPLVLRHRREEAAPPPQHTVCYSTWKPADNAAEPALLVEVDPLPAGHLAACKTGGPKSRGGPHKVSMGITTLAVKLKELSWEPEFVPRLLGTRPRNVCFLDSGVDLQAGEMMRSEMATREFKMPHASVDEPDAVATFVSRAFPALLQCSSVLFVGVHDSGRVIGWGLDTAAASWIADVEQWFQGVFPPLPPRCVTVRVHQVHITAALGHDGENASCLLFQEEKKAVERLSHEPICGQGYLVRLDDELADRLGCNVALFIPSQFVRTQDKVWRRDDQEESWVDEFHAAQRFKRVVVSVQLDLPQALHNAMLPTVPIRHAPGGGPAPTNGEVDPPDVVNAFCLDERAPELRHVLMDSLAIYLRLHSSSGHASIRSALRSTLYMTCLMASDISQALEDVQQFAECVITFDEQWIIDEQLIIQKWAGSAAKRTVCQHPSDWIVVIHLDSLEDSALKGAVNAATVAVSASAARSLSFVVFLRASRMTAALDALRSYSELVGAPGRAVLDVYMLGLPHTTADSVDALGSVNGAALARITRCFEVVQRLSDAPMPRAQVASLAASWYRGAAARPAPWDLLEADAIPALSVVDDVVNYIKQKASAPEGSYRVLLRKPSGGSGATTVLRQVAYRLCEWALTVWASDSPPATAEDRASLWGALLQAALRHGNRLVVVVDEDVSDVADLAGRMPVPPGYRVFILSVCQAEAPPEELSFSVSPYLNKREIEQVHECMARALSHDKADHALIEALGRARDCGAKAGKQDYDTHLFVFALTVSRGEHTPAKEFVARALNGLDDKARQRLVVLAFLSVFATLQQYRSLSMQAHGTGLFTLKMPVTGAPRSKEFDLLRLDHVAQTVSVVHPFIARLILLELKLLHGTPKAEDVVKLWKDVFELLQPTQLPPILAKITRNILLDRPDREPFSPCVDGITCECMRL